MTDSGELELQIMLGIVRYMSNRQEATTGSPASLTEILENLPAGVSIGTLIGTITQPQEVHMDNYEVGQAGSVGPHSISLGHTFTQVWNQNKTEIDLALLAEELRRLRTEARIATSGAPEEDLALGELASAELAAQDGDGAKALSHLKRAGNWVLDVARDIGVPVAIKALEAALGVPGV